jgi:WD40 repeat protein
MHFSASSLVRFCFAVLLSVFTISTAGIVHAQSLSITNIDASQFPRMRANVYAFDAQGTPIIGGGTVRLTEDGVQRSVSTFFCPAVQTKPISAVLTIDISGSMGYPVSNGPIGAPTGVSRLEIARAAATAFTNSLQADGSECAVTAFESFTYLIQDFTADRAKLSSAIASLLPRFGTDYQRAFLDVPTGALAVAASAKNANRAIIFLTDGLSNAPTEAIAAQARALNFKVYCITIGLNAPSVLKTIAESTNGQVFENVNSVAAAEQIYRDLANRIRTDAPCTIEWTSDAPCLAQARTVQVETTTTPRLTATTQYVPPFALRSQLTFAPLTTPIGSVSKGETAQKTLTVSLLPTSAPVVVSRITSSDPDFSIKETTPFTIASGQTKDLTVQYTAPDSAYKFVTFTMQTGNGCSFDFYAVAGFPGFRPARGKGEELKLVIPNGGEEFLVGIDTLITWKGVPPDEAVRLDYSIDNGTTWNLITENATGLSYKWRVPNSPSVRCLARVTQKNTNSALFGSDSSIVLGGHNAPVRMAKFDQRFGSKAVTVGDDFKFFLWDGVGGTREEYTNMRRPYAAAFNAQGDLAVGYSTGGNNVLVLPGGNPDLATGFSALVQASIRTIDFSPNVGSRMVITTDAAESAIRIYDFALQPVGRLFYYDLPQSSGQAYTARYTPDGSGIVAVIAGAVSAGGAVKFWDVRGEPNISGLVSTWSPPDAIVIHADVTQVNGKIFIAATCNDRTVRFLEFLPNGQLVESRTLPRLIHQGRVSFASFDPTGTFVVTASTDNTDVIVWRMGEALPITILKNAKGHTGGVNTAYFSPDGTRVITAGNDNKAIIWFIQEKLPLQKDESDAVWSIVRPKLKGKDIDMGQVVVGTLKDSLVTATLTNSTKYPIAVARQFFKTPNGTFSVISGGAPFTVQPLSDYPVEFRFRPGTTGVAADSVFFITVAGDVLGVRITGTGISPFLAVQGTLVDFGTIPVGSSKDSTVKALVKNTGTVPITFAPPRVRFAGSGLGVSVFRVVNAGAITLQPGDSIELPLQFLPNTIGRVSGALEFAFSSNGGIGSPVTVPLFGTGIQPGPQISTREMLLAIPAAVCDSAIITTTLYNTGTRVLTIKSATIETAPNTSTGAALLRILNPPTSIGVGDSVRVNIAYIPLRRGTISGVLVLESDALNQPTVRVPIIGDSLVFDRSFIAFLPVEAGSSTSAIVNVTNAGNAPAPWLAAPRVVSPFFRIEPLEPMAFLQSGRSSALRITFTGTANRAGVTYTDSTRFSNSCSIFTNQLAFSATVKSAPRLAVQSVPSLSTCSSSATLSVSVVNTGTADGFITNAQSSNPAFVLGSTPFPTPQSPLRVPIGETVRITVNVSAVRSGLLTSVVSIQESSTATVQSTATLSVNKSDVGVEFVPNSVRFVNLEENTSSTGTVTLINRSSTPLDLSRIPVGGQFSITPNTGSIPPYAAQVLTVRFTGAPANANISRSSQVQNVITGTSELCASEATLQLSANTIAPISAVLSLSDIATQAGDRVRSLVMLKNRNRIAVGMVIRDELRFNASLLLPELPTPQGRVEYGERIIPFRWTVTSNDETQALDTLHFRAMLGNAPATPLTLTGSPETRLERATILAASGATFQLLGLSQAAGTRLILTTAGTVEIRDVRPNPASDALTVDFWSRNAEPYTMTIVSAFGQELLTTTVSAQAGINTQTVDVSDVPQNVYFVRLRNRREFVVRKFFVVR